ncbi:MAG: hypothetical protein MPI95_03030 [Nitrosopumilus sp.]|nr:hypothetical protein [Nitrosopumilus sp.]CAI9831885.1 hypothetical protein IBTHAUMO2_470002 [Nitrosopumilaceae archaeon]MDA7944698.1 hypothetical protein [Nitrosopumilus sp.]MDA7952860.1 hypothetical protein [Nitrosopumilus sp.]MDA7954347.1 hypothetical protein [Nitrosopumilus sp.]
MRHQADMARYAFIADLEPASAPRLEEPLLHPPYLGYRGDKWGYSDAVHNPYDDSVTFWYEHDRVIRPTGSDYTIPKSWKLPFDAYRQTYGVNQTFAYRCLDKGDAKILHMYQYRGSNLFQGNLSLVLVHFELEVPPDTPCEYPDLLRYTVDVYDTGGFDGLYNLEQYREKPGVPYDPLVDPVRHAVLMGPVYEDPIPAGWPMFGPEPPVVNPDGSVTLVHTVDYRNGTTVSHTGTYQPREVFVTGCIEREGATQLAMYSYLGSVEIPRATSPVSLAFANWEAYTRAPIPCTFPDYIERTAGAFDLGRLNWEWDRESFVSWLGG